MKHGQKMADSNELPGGGRLVIRVRETRAPAS
jgi:hypothetical protein